MARIAFLLGKDYEDSEFRVPYDRLRGKGHECIVIGKRQGEELEGKQGQDRITTDYGVNDVDVDQFDAVVIPGGYSPDHLRTHEEIALFTRHAVESGKPVAAICHGGSLLIEADVVRGRRVTGWPSIRTDLVNAGAEWVDEAVVEDGNLITSRHPGDLEVFCDAIERALAAAPAGHRPGVS